LIRIKYVKGTNQNWVIHKRWADCVRIWTSETPGQGEDEALPRKGAPIQLTDDPTISIPASEVANVPLLRARLVRLLLDSPNHTRPFSNLILACGYADPAKSDRRFFTSRVHDMISDGTLQKFKLNDKGGDRIVLSEKFFAEREQSSEETSAAEAYAPVLGSISEDADNGDIYEHGGKGYDFNPVPFLSNP
jgi:oxalate---CoA ligase